MFLDSQPVNPQPFLIALNSHLVAGGEIRDPKSRRILYFLYHIVSSQLKHNPWMVDMKAVQEEVKKADQEKAKTKSGILDCHCVLYVHTLSSTYHTTF